MSLLMFKSNQTPFATKILFSKEIPLNLRTALTGKCELPALEWGNKCMVAIGLPSRHQPEHLQSRKMLQYRHNCVKLNMCGTQYIKNNVSGPCDHPGRRPPLMAWREKVGQGCCVLSPLCMIKTRRRALWNPYSA